MVLNMITWVVLTKKPAYNREQDEQVVHIYETIQGDYSIPYYSTLHIYIYEQCTKDDNFKFRVYFIGGLAMKHFKQCKC
jgi:hypothetical protein